MAKFKIRYTKDAVDDLDSIFDYISEKNQMAAINMLKKVERSILSLSENPRKGSVLPTTDFSFVEYGYRRLVINPYIVFYRIISNDVIIARIIHSKQDWLHLLFENNFTDES